MISCDTTDNRRTLDEDRIAQIESDAIPQYRTVIRAIDIASLGVADVKALNDLMTAFGIKWGTFCSAFQVGNTGGFARETVILNGAIDWFLLRKQRMPLPKPKVVRRSLFFLTTCRHANGRWRFMRLPTPRFASDLWQNTIVTLAVYFPSAFFTAASTTGINSAVRALWSSPNRNRR